MYKSLRFETHKLCLAYLLSFVEQVNGEELVRPGGLSNQKIKKGTFVRFEKLSFGQSPVKICDVVGTSTDHVQIRLRVCQETAKPVADS